MSRLESNKERSLWFSNAIVFLNPFMIEANDGHGQDGRYNEKASNNNINSDRHYAFHKQRLWWWLGGKEDEEEDPGLY